MTPSMLVKINDLRSSERVIFIINTNYEERIDKAIKRPGRIDEQFLILPPDEEVRIKLVHEILDELKEYKNIDPEIKINAELNIKVVAKKTALYSYEELKRMIKEESTKIITSDSYKGNIKEPMISLKSYEVRFSKDSNYPQKPMIEFLLMIYLKNQVNALTQDDKRLCRTIKKSIIENNYMQEEILKHYETADIGYIRSLLGN